MQKPPWFSDKKRLARRIRSGYIFRELSFWVPVGLICWGLMVFLVRFVSTGPGNVLWYGSAFLVASLLVGVYRGYREASDVNVTAVLDHLSDSENLLVSLEETGAKDASWVSTVEERLGEGVSMPGLRWGKMSMFILPALAFLLLVWFVPLSGITNQTANASSSYLKERVEELRERLKTVESEDLMTEEKTEQMEKKLDQLKERLETNRPADDNPWSVMDRMDRELETAMTEGSETLNRARKLSRNLSDELKKQESNKSGDGSKDTSSDTSKAESGAGNDGNRKASKERRERQKEALSRSLARLSRRGMMPDPKSMSSSPEDDEDTDYRSRQRATPRKQSSKTKTGKNESQKRNWKKLVSRRKALKKLRRKLRKKHQRMHRKGICRGGRCQLKGNRNGRRSGMARGNGQKSGRTAAGGEKNGKGSQQGQPTNPNGTPATGPGTAPMTDGETSGKEDATFATKKVDAPLVNPEGTEKLQEHVKAGENMKPGDASVSSGTGANVEDPLESRRSRVPPDYRESVKSYFDPETD